MCFVSVVTLFLHQAGVDAAFAQWGLPAIIGVAVWLIGLAITETRGRVRLMPVLVGGVAGASLAGLLALLLFSLDVAEINDHAHPKFWNRDTAIFRGWAQGGAFIGLLLGILASWRLTSKRSRVCAVPNGGQPQSPPAANEPAPDGDAVPLAEQDY
jgi:hypothetical protein